MLCETEALVSMLILAFCTSWSLYRGISQGCAHHTYTAPKAYNTQLNSRQFRLQTMNISKLQSKDITVDMSLIEARISNPKQLTKIFLKEQVKRNPQALHMRSESDIYISSIFGTEQVKTTA